LPLNWSYKALMSSDLGMLISNQFFGECGVAKPQRDSEKEADPHASVGSPGATLREPAPAVSNHFW
jgi:hypothetical protein